MTNGTSISQNLSCDQSVDWLLTWEFWYHNKGSVSQRQASSPCVSVFLGCYVWAVAWRGRSRGSESVATARVCRTAAVRWHDLPTQALSAPHWPCFLLAGSTCEYRLTNSPNLSILKTYPLPAQRPRSWLCIGCVMYGLKLEVLQYAKFVANRHNITIQAGPKQYIDHWCINSKR